MDISGVDVDNLNDNEILYLCSDIGDFNNDEISVLKDVDVNNLSDDKVQDIYENVISGSQNYKTIYLTEQQFLDINYDTVDRDDNEIFLLNGQNVNLKSINSLSDDEVLAVYEDAIVGNSSLIADCYSFQHGVYNSGTGTTYTDAYCYDGRGNLIKVSWPSIGSVYLAQLKGMNLLTGVNKYLELTYDLSKGHGDCDISKCSDYAKLEAYCISYVYSAYFTTYFSSYYVDLTYYATKAAICK